MSLVRYHSTSRRQDLTPDNILRTQARLLQPLRHILTISRQRIIILIRLASEKSLDTNAIRQLDIHLNNTTKFLRNLSRTLSKRETLGRINVKEDADKDDSENHVQLLLGEHTLWILTRLEGQVKHPRDKVRVRNVTHVPYNINLHLPRKSVRLLRE